MKTLAKYKEYELTCDNIYHYFKGKDIKEPVRIEKCWCGNKKETI